MAEEENQGFYYKLEDKYYALMEWFEQKLHIPLVKYFVDPIESKGIPSFPFFVIALLAIVAVAGFFALPTLSTLGLKTTSLDVQVMSGSSPIDGATVDLYYNDQFFATATSENGFASFEGVPIRDGYSVLVEASGYAKYRKLITLSEEPVVFAAQLQELGPNGEIPTPTPAIVPPIKKYNFLVKVVDGFNSPISGARVSFTSPSEGGDSGSAIAGADGIAVLSLSRLDQLLMLKAYADGYVDGAKTALAKSGGVTVSLELSNAGFDPYGDNPAGPGTGENPVNPAKGSVRVNVRDSLGNGVETKCTLYDANLSDAIDSDSTEVGLCFFQEKVDVGKYVYVKVEPKNPSLLPNSTESLEMPLSGELDFAITLESTTAASTQEIKLTLQDEEGQPISGANINVYLLDTNKNLFETSTDENGLASFKLSSSLELVDLYFTAYAEGFLPANSIIPKNAYTLALVRAITGNNAEATVKVIDDDKKVVSGAKVVLFDYEGKLLGVPYAVTDTAGTVRFVGLPLETELRAHASSDVRYGDSGVFSLALGEEEKEIEVSLEPAKGDLALTLKDVATNELIPVGAATAKLAKDGSLAGTCTIENGTCLIENVLANKELIIEATSPDYVTYTTSSFAVPANQKLEKEFKLLPLSLSNQTQVFLAGVMDENGVDVSSQSTFEKAGYYWVRIAATFPKGAQEQGVFVRVGDQSNAAQEPAVITAFDYSPAGLGAPTHSSGSSFIPSADATTDLLNNEVTNGAKWVQVYYSGLTGTVELKARIFVKPTAKANSDKINVYYRAWSRSAEVFSYEPKDDALGNARKAADKDSFYAQSKLASFNVVDGSFYCNEEGTACVQVQFTREGESGAFKSPAIVNLGKGFGIVYSLKTFAPFDLESAYVKWLNPDRAIEFENAVIGDGNIQSISAYEKKIVFDEAKQNYSGVLAGTAKFPVQNAKLVFEFGDQRGPILTNDKLQVIVQGNGRLVIKSLSSTYLEVGKRKDLTAVIESSQGVSVTDAKLAFEEMDEAEWGAPFAGTPPASVLGEDSEGFGQEGKYVFKKVRTLAPGKFLLRVTREGFEEATTEIDSRATELFTLSPEDGIELSCEGSTLSIKNLLDVNMPIDFAIDSGIDGTPCAELSGPSLVKKSSNSPGESSGSSSGTVFLDGETSAGNYVEQYYHLETFKAGATKNLKIKPTSAGDCTVRLSSKDARSGSNYEVEYEVSNLCTEFASTTNTSFSDVTNITGFVVRAQNNLWVGPDGKTSPARLLVPYQNDTEDDSVNVAVFFVNLDAASHTFYCQNRAKEKVFEFTAEQFNASTVVNFTFTKPGMYYCYLDGETTNSKLAKIKIKSKCPHHGVSYYTGFIAACLLKENVLKGTPLGDIVNFGASAWEVASSIYYHFDATSGSRIPAEQAVSTYANPYLSTTGAAQMGSPVCGVQGMSYPGMQQQGYTWNPQQNAYTTNMGAPQTGITTPQGAQGTLNSGAYAALGNQCYGSSYWGAMNYAPPKEPGIKCTQAGIGMHCTIEITPMMRSAGVPFVLDNVVLDRMPFLKIQKKLYDSTTDNCVQLVDLDNSFGTKIGEALGKGFFQMTGFGSYPLSRSFALVFNPNDDDKCINYEYKDGKLVAVPNIKGTAQLKIGTGVGAQFQVTLTVKPMADDPMAPYYLMTVPAGGSVAARPYGGEALAGADGVTPTRPSIVEPYLFINNVPGKKVDFSYYTQAGSIERTTAGSPTTATKQSIILFAPKVANNEKPLKTVKIGEQELNGELFTTGIADVRDTTKIPAELRAITLLDVVGGVGAETSLGKIMQCSGTKYCREAESLEAATAMGDLAEKAIRKSFTQMPFVYKRDFLQAQDAGFENCLNALATELIADRASEAVCKTLFNMCNTDGFDAEEEEIEEGESGDGFSWSGISSSAGDAVKTVLCQGTALGQQTQAIEGIFGDANARNLLRQAFGRALGAGTYKPQALQPLMDKVELPEIYFMLKKSEPQGGGEEGIGMRFFKVRVKDYNDLLIQQDKADGWETVYDESGFVPGKPPVWREIGSLPYQALKEIVVGIYDWAREKIAVSGKNRDYSYIVFDPQTNQYSIVFNDAPTIGTLNKFIVQPFVKTTKTKDAQTKKEKIISTEYDSLNITEVFNNARGTANVPTAAGVKTVFVSSYDADLGSALPGALTEDAVDTNDDLISDSAAKIISSLSKTDPFFGGDDGYFVIRLVNSNSWSKNPELKVILKEPAFAGEENATVLEQVKEIIKYYADEAYMPTLPAKKKNWPCITNFTTAEELIGVCTSKDRPLTELNLTLQANTSDATLTELGKSYGANGVTIVDSTDAKAPLKENEWKTKYPAKDCTYFLTTTKNSSGDIVYFGDELGFGLEGKVKAPNGQDSVIAPFGFMGSMLPTNSKEVTDKKPRIKITFEETLASDSTGEKIVNIQAASGLSYRFFEEPTPKTGYPRIIQTELTQEILSKSPRALADLFLMQFNTVKTNKKDLLSGKVTIKATFVDASGAEQPGLTKTKPIVICINPVDNVKIETLQTASKPSELAKAAEGAKVKPIDLLADDAVNGFKGLRNKLLGVNSATFTPRDAANPAAGGKIRITFNPASGFKPAGWTGTVIQLKGTATKPGSPGRSAPWYWKNPKAELFTESNYVIEYEVLPFGTFCEKEWNQGGDCIKMKENDRAFFELFVCKDGYIPKLAGHSSKLAAVSKDFKDNPSSYPDLASKTKALDKVLYEGCVILAYPYPTPLWTPLKEKPKDFTPSTALEPKDEKCTYAFTIEDPARHEAAQKAWTAAKSFLTTDSKQLKPECAGVSSACSDAIVAAGFTVAAPSGSTGALYVVTQTQTFKLTGDNYDLDGGKIHIVLGPRSKNLIPGAGELVGWGYVTAKLQVNGLPDGKYTAICQDPGCDATTDFDVKDGKAFVAINGKTNLGYCFDNSCVNAASLKVVNSAGAQVCTATATWPPGAAAAISGVNDLKKWARGEECSNDAQCEAGLKCVALSDDTIFGTPSKVINKAKKVCVKPSSVVALESTKEYCLPSTEANECATGTCFSNEASDKPRHYWCVAKTGRGAACTAVNQKEVCGSKLTCQATIAEGPYGGKSVCVDFNTNLQSGQVCIPVADTPDAECEAGLECRRELGSSSVYKCGSTWGKVCTVSADCKNTAYDCRELNADALSPITGETLAKGTGACAETRKVFVEGNECLPFSVQTECSAPWSCNPVMTGAGTAGLSYKCSKLAEPVVEKKAVGEACTDATGCLSGVCKVVTEVIYKGNKIDSGKQVCVPAPNSVADGEECLPTQATTGQCTVDSVCTPASLAGASKYSCQKVGATARGKACPGGTSCLSGKCAPVKAYKQDGLNLVEGAQVCVEDRSVGQSCMTYKLSGGTGDECTGDAVCQLDAGTSLYRCVVVPTIMEYGQACDETHTCRTGLQCKKLTEKSITDPTGLPIESNTMVCVKPASASNGQYCLPFEGGSECNAATLSCKLSTGLAAKDFLHTCQAAATTASNAGAGTQKGQRGDACLTSADCAGTSNECYDEANGCKKADGTAYYGLSGLCRQVSSAFVFGGVTKPAGKYCVGSGAPYITTSSSLCMPFTAKNAGEGDCKTGAACAIKSGTSEYHCQLKQLHQACTNDFECDQATYPLSCLAVSGTNFVVQGGKTFTDGQTVCAVDTASQARYVLSAGNNCVILKSGNSECGLLQCKVTNPAATNTHYCST